MTRFILNEKIIETDLPPGMLLLDFIRYHQHLVGTKIGCREGDCGACTILVGNIVNNELQYQAMTSCLLPLGNARGKHVVTIEGINMTELNPVQQAMADQGATQCGFCTPGFVMSLAGYCLNAGDPAYVRAIEAVDGNICRCTGYKSIERAALIITNLMKDRKEETVTNYVTRKKILPSYFSGIHDKLLSIREAEKNTSIAVRQLPIVAGGTDLYVQQPEELSNTHPGFVFDEPSLKGIRLEGTRCIVGPSSTVTDLKYSPEINQAFPAFQEYVKLISSTPIRNMATVAGNFINASPIGDLTIIFLALNAQLVISNEGRETTRNIPLRTLYKGYKLLDKTPEEHISQIWFEMPGQQYRFHFEKVSKRTHLDIASVNTAISLESHDNLVSNVIISAGGVGPVPMVLEKTSTYLNNKTPSRELIGHAVEIMRTEISPISDTRGSKEYKTLLLGQLIKAHFIRLYPEIMLSTGQPDKGRG